MRTYCIILIIVLYASFRSPSVLAEDADENDLTERVELLEDNLELYHDTKVQTVLNAFDRSSLATEIIKEMRFLNKRLSVVSVDIGKGASTLESMERAFEKSQKRIEKNATGLNVVGSRINTMEIKIPVLERRVDILEVRNEKERESLRNAYLELAVLAIMGGMSWVAALFYRKYRALKKGRRADD